MIRSGRKVPTPAMPIPDLAVPNAAPMPGVSVSASLRRARRSEMGSYSRRSWRTRCRPSWSQPVSKQTQRMWCPKGPPYHANEGRELGSQLRLGHVGCWFGIAGRQEVLAAVLQVAGRVVAEARSWIRGCSCLARLAGSREWRSSDAPARHQRAADGARDGPGKIDQAFGEHGCVLSPLPPGPAQGLKAWPLRGPRRGIRFAIRHTFDSALRFLILVGNCDSGEASAVFEMRIDPGRGIFGSLSHA